MGLICCFTCGFEKELNNKKVNIQYQQTEFSTIKRLHKCGNPDLKIFLINPKHSKVILEYSVYKGYCSNCLAHVTRLSEDEIRYWFRFMHLKSRDNDIEEKKDRCKSGDLIINYIEDWKSRKKLDQEEEEENLEFALQDYNITLEDLSKETGIEEGNEQVASWIRVDPGRNNALEVYIANEILNEKCPLCNYSFKQEDINTRKLEGYNEYYEPIYKKKSDDEIWFEFIHQRYTNLNRHFKEFHYYEYENNPQIKIPRQLNVTFGMLQQLVLFENSLKMQYQISSKTIKEKLKWRKENNMKKIDDKYSEFSDKRARVTRRLYKDYLLPTRMISEMLIDSETNIRSKGYHGMILDNDIPKWLLDVTANIIHDEEREKSSSKSMDSFQK